MKLTWGQTTVLVVTATPMAAVGVAGAVATFVNMNHVLHRGWSALGLVAAGEGATLICALVALAVTLMGQHTPATVRFGMWAVPVAASAVGVALAPSGSEAVVMAFTPLAMTAAGEGVAFVARRVVAYRTGTDIEQQRRSGLLLWHANRAAKGGRIASRISKAAVWRLTKAFAETDTQMSVQLGEIQRFRIGEGADENLAAVMSGRPQDTEHRAPQWVLDERARRRAALAPAKASEAADSAVEGPRKPSPWFDRYKSLKGEEVPPSLPPVPFEPVEIPADQWNFKIEVEEPSRVPVGTWQPVPLDEDETEPHDEGPTLLTAADVIAIKGCKPGTIRTWVARGKLNRIWVDGTAYYDAAEVAAL